MTNVNGGIIKAWATLIRRREYDKLPMASKLWIVLYAAKLRAWLRGDRITIEKLEIE